MRASATSPLAGSVIVLALGTPSPARAQACGPVTISGTTDNVVCSSAGNNYAGGISYALPDANALDVTLNSDVEVVNPTSGSAVFAWGTGSTILNANAATIDYTNPSAIQDGVAGLSAITNNGDASVTSQGRISIVTGASSYGISSETRGSGNALVNYAGPGITLSGGSNSILIVGWAVFGSNGNATVDASGAFSGTAINGGTGLGGLFAYAGYGAASVALNGGGVTMQGSGVFGIAAEGGTTSQITTGGGTSVTLTSADTVGPALYAESFSAAASGGAVTIASASGIRVTGTSGAALSGYADVDAPIDINATGPGLTVTGDGGTGILALSGGGKIQIHSSAPIKVSGSGAYGISADSGTLVNASSGQAPGPGGSIVITTSAPVSASGKNAVGVYANSTTGAIQIQATDVAGTADGIVARNTGSSSLRVTTTGTVTGQTGDAIQTGATGPATTAVTIGSSSVVAGANSAINVTPGMSQPAVISNAGVIQNLSRLPSSPAIISAGGHSTTAKATGPTSITNSNLVTGTVDLGGGEANSFTNSGTGIWSTAGGTNWLSGAQVTDGSGEINNQGTIIAAPSGATAPVTTTFNGIGQGTFSNAGTIAMRNGVAGDQTVITGHYNGLGGTVTMDTYLGADSSPTDRLVLNGGQATGNTILQIFNISGPGALTTGNGIEMVSAINGATTASSAFHLSGSLQAGAYQYLLYRGGRGSTDAWYLRSTLEAQGAGMATPASPGTTTPAPPSTPAPPVGSSGETAPAAWRPAVVGYEMTPQLNVDYGFAMLGRLHERVGDIANVGHTEVGNDEAIWARLGGQNLDADAANRFTSNERMFFAQFGKDWTLSGAPHMGSTHAGVTVTIGSSSATFSDSLRDLVPGLSTSTGSVETQAQGIGGYWTRYLPDGSYADTVGVVTHYSNRYGDSYGDSGSQNGFGAALSEEVGKPLQIASSGVAVEPQAQLMYGYLNLNGFADGVSSVSGTVTNALRGRIGMRVFRANLSNDTHSAFATPYFTADILHDFLTPGQTTVGGTAIDSALGRTWYELGCGVTASYGKAGRLYVNVRYAHDMGGQYRQAVYGQAGYRYSW